MKKTDTNIIMITAGGIGQRFGSDVPKQFLLLAGKPVISYVIEACKQSKKADSILVVTDIRYHDYVLSTFNVDVTQSGSTLNETKRNGFDYIKTNSTCEKVIVVEAVRPTISVETIDKFFDYLEQYEAVACARRITDSLGRVGQWIVDREQYYTLNPPEGFRFSLLDQNFKASSPLTESIQQLPATTNVLLDFDVPYYEKITYPEDLIKLELQISKNGFK